MAQRVNPSPRKRQFPRREARARRTRQSISTAAGKLFVTEGYGATTIQAIADEADVAVQTVYATFGSKRALLEHLLDISLAGDDAEVAVNDREWMQQVFEAPTATERLTAYAAAVRGINDRVADLMLVLEVAAAVDPDLVSLAHTTEDRRRLGAQSVVKSVTSVGTLRDGLTRRQAIDIVWLLNGPATFRQLVRRAGWTAAAYESWLARALTTELLGSEQTS